MILYPTHDELKPLNEAILKYGYWPDYSKCKFRVEDYENLEDIVPIVIACGVLTGILEQIIYPPLKINETVLG